MARVSRVRDSLRDGGFGHGAATVTAHEEDGMDESGGSTPRVRRLVGVYNADGTLRGEVTYVVGKLLGRAHCGLCDITHGAVSVRSEWKTCRTALAVPFDTFHRNDQPDAARPLTDGRLPAVLADTDSGFVFLLGADELDACAKSPERLMTAVEAAVASAGLSFV